MAEGEEGAFDRRIFTRLMKQACWNKAATVPGRHPDRWRLDATGNVVAYRLRGCEGCACHEYDHIVPYSRGGPTSVENCQVLQTRVNRHKGAQVGPDGMELASYSCARSMSNAEMDFMEMALYGNVKRDGRECRVFSIFELFYNSRFGPEGGSVSGHGTGSGPSRDRHLGDCA